MRVNTDGKRNEKDLTKEQLDEAINFAVKLGMPIDRIVYSPYECTAYGALLDILIIGTDVLPLGIRTNKPNSNISLKGTISHEIVGHREAALKKKTQSNSLLEEVQASIRAARFTPDLNYQERIDLIKDAIVRLKKANIKIKDIKSKLYIDER